MNEQSQICRTYKQDIGSNGSKEDISCLYVRLIFNIRLSTSDILPTIIMVFVVVVGCCRWSSRCLPQNCQSLLSSTSYF